MNLRFKRGFVLINRLISFFVLVKIHIFRTPRAHESVWRGVFSVGPNVLPNGLNDFEFGPNKLPNGPNDSHFGPNN